MRIILVSSPSTLSQNRPAILISEIWSHSSNHSVGAAVTDFWTPLIGPHDTADPHRRTRSRGNNRASCVSPSPNAGIAAIPDIYTRADRVHPCYASSTALPAAIAQRASEDGRIQRVAHEAGRNPRPMHGPHTRNLPVLAARADPLTSGPAASFWITSSPYKRWRAGPRLSTSTRAPSICRTRSPSRNSPRPLLDALSLPPPLTKYTR
ncbi:hypothetical protein B0H21DRAFT_47839 [Amylocystis lapponica]|nr:hypothetical protein B0H21DRAFT_47839 [Amylocystis lapponica]